jgi:hypothetical protein
MICQKSSLKLDWGKLVAAVQTSEVVLIQMLCELTPAIPWGLDQKA